MSTEATNLKVADLRQEFDRAFALPPPEPAAGFEDLLAIRVGDDGYAVRLRELGGLVARQTIVPVPGRSPHLMGLSGIRGRITPVFGLAGLLGYGAGSEVPRWVVLDASADPIAFAFQGFDGYVRVPRSAIHPLESRPGSRPFLSEAIRTTSDARAIIGIAQLVASVRSATRAKEQ